MSRIGKKIITLPKGVSVTIGEQALEVKGPKGSLKTPIPAGISFKLEGAELRAERASDDLAPLHDSADGSSAIAARLQVGVVAQVKKCTSGWCHVAGNGFDGWIEQQRLWGVYADEKVE